MRCTCAFFMVALADALRLHPRHAWQQSTSPNHSVKPEAVHCWDKSSAKRVLVLGDGVDFMLSRASKSAGSTLESLLRQVIPNAVVAGEGSTEASAMRDHRLCRNRTFIVATVRNPCEWYISWWEMFRWNEGLASGCEGPREPSSYCNVPEYRKCIASFADMHDHQLMSVASFRRWVTSAEGWKAKISYNFWKKHLVQNSALASQCPFFCSPESSSCRSCTSLS
eukprot:gnl/TRDRNA2_/TRDRNA2_132808_c0_seq2.p1 gnl/TRDRNA2_/TRDRNA2_132808_c0~~gnl/TRDRNA2_/TRDRNA2_132808_c0_seq2.p1  ORF type:complete len:224 (-),score=22.47 gnl/TRDRNA2_/TRDRNA2_132808_c0_seq2:368-1039(-)